MEYLGLVKVLASLQFFVYASYPSLESSGLVHLAKIQAIVTLQREGMDLRSTVCILLLLQKIVKTPRYTKGVNT